MIIEKTLKALEFDKILLKVSDCAVLEETKKSVSSFCPLTDIKSAQILLNKTQEAFKLLYTFNVNNILFFDNVSDALDFADKGGTLNNADLLKIATNLKSARISKNSILSVNDETLVLLPEIASRLYVNPEFEKEISSKIISVDEISDNASNKLYSIRKSIRNLNASIRDKLNSYMRGGLSKYLQDSVVTMRHDRFVVPVKSEYRSFIRGFIHDQSSSGSTVFIEPEQVMELNNELKRAMLEEADEIEKILFDLSCKVSSMSDAIRYNAENLVELDQCFCRAQYSFKNKCLMPKLNDIGYVDIKYGRHPLIDACKVVPVSVSIGKDYNFLLITGPNTGGKTVTLKLVGLLSLMAMSGLFVPTNEVSDICVYNDIFCDIGDEQSIENDLSTFSSHIKNLIDILNKVNTKSLILIDEIGAGTDPEEGSALALAIIKNLISKNCFGIITTHYSLLKEFAMQNDKIINASMEFDALTLKPLYRLLIGIPGSSNALNIAKTLGLEQEIINDALSLMTSEKISFENILQSAEKSRREAENLKSQLEIIKKEKEAELKKISEEREKIIKEREKIVFNAKQETKRIVSDKLADAEEIIAELKNTLKKTHLENKDVFKASELKNRLKNSVYLTVENQNQPVELIKAEVCDIKIGNKVYVKSLDAFCKIVSVNAKKKEVEVSLGNIKSIVKFNDLFNSEKDCTTQKINVTRKTSIIDFKNELNVVGKTSLEAIEEVEFFLDRAVIAGVEEIKIIHGVATGTLLKTIREMLKKDKRVKQFRRGIYGEGENGVTIVTLK